LVTEDLTLASDAFGNDLPGRRLVCLGWLLLCAVASSCSTGLDGDSIDAGGDANLVVMDSGPDSPFVAEDGGSAAGGTLCNGEPSVRLAFQTVGGGQTLPGSRVVIENGFRYLVVTGDCRYWVMKDDELDVHEGTLTPQEAAGVETALRLSEWSSLNAMYARCGADVPSDLLRFDETRVAISGCIGGEAPKWLVAGLEMSLEKLYAAGTSVEGPTRFLLITEASIWPALLEARAALWPLADDPMTLARTYEEASRYTPGTSQVASSADAGALRKLRRDFFASGGGQYSGGFIPVLGPDGARYQLFARDSIPLEDAQGLLHVQ
jgi:hypothetical protein